MLRVSGALPLLGLLVSGAAWGQPGPPGVMPNPSSPAPTPAPSGPSGPGVDTPAADAPPTDALPTPTAPLAPVGPDALPSAPDAAATPGTPAADPNDTLIIIDAAPATGAGPAADTPDSGDELLIIDDGGAAASSPGTTLNTFLGTTRFSGKLGTWLLIDSRGQSNGEDVAEWRNLARATLAHEVNRQWRFYGDAWVRWGAVGAQPRGEPLLLVNARNPKWTGEAELREAYVGFRRDGWEINAGQRIYVWGKNEILPPADVINPMDLRYTPLDLLASTKDGKVPVVAADIAYGGEVGTAQLVVVPFFTRHEGFVFGRDFSLAPAGSALSDRLSFSQRIHPSIEDQIQRSLQGTELPEESPRNTSVALRLTSKAGGWDFAATASYGWDRTPVIHADADLLLLLDQSEAIAADPQLLVNDAELRDAATRVQQQVALGEALVEATYRRQAQFALEAEGVVGDFVLRADVGFSPEQVFYDEGLAPVVLPSGRAVVGAEYTYGESWFLSASAFTSLVFSPPAERRLLALEIPTAALDRKVVDTLGGSFVGRWRWEEENLEVQLGGLLIAEPLSWVANAAVRWKFFRDNEVTVGCLLIDGDDGGPGETYTGNDFVYVGYEGAW